MVFTWPTNKVPLTLVIGVQTAKPQEIKLIADDPGKFRTEYTNRRGMVNGYREFEVLFPQSPPVTKFTIYNTAFGNYDNGIDKSFKIVKLEPKSLATKPIFLDADDREFIKFAKFFSENASELSSGAVNPHIYGSDKRKFYIDYYDVIRDRTSGAEVNTPARIGHKTGIIEVSKKDFLTYSVPMRMIILLHEYSHKYKNPKDNRPIGYETGADINGLNMYLSLGYSPLEAQYAFLRVFKGADNAQNKKRYLIINDFITKFVNGEMQEHYKSL